MKYIYTALLLISFLSVNTKTQAQFRIVGYLNTWDNFPENARNVDFKKITHLNIAFANPDENGMFTPFKGLPALAKVVHSYHVKILMSLGGAALSGTKKNWKSLTQPDSVKSFCEKILAYVKANNLDGVDIDLEGNIIGKNYGGFIEMLSSVMKPENKLVTAAVATWFADQVPASCFAYFDFVNVMSYDATGPWDPEHPGPSSPYSMAVSDLDFWATKGLPATKTDLGVPFYGWGFYNKFSQEEYAYKDLIKQYPYSLIKDQVADTIYYNGMPTIMEKTRLATQKAGGIMIWQLTEDTHGKKSLLSAINKIAKEKRNTENVQPVPIADNDFNTETLANTIKK